jgi:hypothetical protein
VARSAALRVREANQPMSEKSMSLARRIGLVATALFCVALTVFLVDTTIDIWPALGTQSDLCKKAASMTGEEREAFLEVIKRAGKVNCKFGDLPVTRVNLGGTHTFLSADQALVGLVALIAMIGALLRSLVGVGNALRSEPGDGFSFGWCLFRPFIAVALGVVIYMAFRAFLLPSGKLVTVNPYGFLTVAALVGIFTDRIVSRLKEADRRLAVRGDASVEPS